MYLLCCYLVYNFLPPAVKLNNIKISKVNLACWDWLWLCRILCVDSFILELCFYLCLLSPLPPEWGGTLILINGGDNEGWAGPGLQQSTPSRQTLSLQAASPGVLVSVLVSWSPGVSPGLMVSWCHGFFFFSWWIRNNSLQKGVRMGVKKSGLKWRPP